MKLIKVFMDYNGEHTVFEILNYKSLDNETLVALDNFAHKKNGYFRHDLELFAVMNKWDEQTAKKIFEYNDFEVFFENHDERNEPLHKQRVYFGTYYGKRWEELPSSYLEWILATTEEQNKYWNLAYAESKRREDGGTVSFDLTKEITFGKYKNTPWVDLPNDYLTWIATSLDSNKENKLLAQATLQYKQQTENNISLSKRKQR